MIVKILHMSLIIAVVGIAGLWTNIGDASAQNYPTDGKSLMYKNCIDSAVAKSSKPFMFKGVSGTVHLMFSNKCKTAWALVQLSKKNNTEYYFNATVKRKTDEKTYSCDSANGNDAVKQNESTCYSAMVYNYTPHSSYAYVDIYHYDGVKKVNDGRVGVTGSY